MAHKIQDGLWATDDGSYGSGTIVVVDTTDWTEAQWERYEEISNNGEVFYDDLIKIDKNEEVD
jgi:hypothetical protein